MWVTGDTAGVLQGLQRRRSPARHSFTHNRRRGDWQLPELPPLFSLTVIFLGGGARDKLTLFSNRGPSFKIEEERDCFGLRFCNAACKAAVKCTKLKGGN